MFTLNGKRINIEAQITIEDVTYSNLRDPEIRDQLGVVEIPDPIREDERYYFVQEIDEAPYVINTPRPLDGIRAQLREKVNAKRSEVETGGFYFVGRKFQSDQRSFNRIQAVAQIAQDALARQLPFTPVDWVAADNVPVYLEAQDVIDLFSALVKHGRDTYLAASAIKRELDEAEDLADLLKVDLDSPFSFVDNPQN
jgi:hypothetical protein